MDMRRHQSLGTRSHTLVFCLPVLLLLAATVQTGAAAQSAESIVLRVKAGDATAVRTLLNQGADPDTAQPDGTTALHWAARVDNLEIAKLLLAEDADPSSANVFGVTPLALASTNGSASMIAELLSAGADPDTPTRDGETPLMTAARSGVAEAVRVLLDDGANPNATHASGQTALMWATAEDHTEAMQLLIAAGAEVHARTPVPEGRRFGRVAPGFTAFLFAARAGHISAAELLRDSGANLHDVLADGTDALVLAATNAHWELGVRLVDWGVDPNAAEVGWTALHAMTWVRRPNFGFNPPGPVRTGNMDSLTFARELVARGADVNARMTAEPRNGYRNVLRRIGATPLLMAARLADEPLMRVFAELGADPTLTNDDGTTLLMVASGVGIHSPGEDPGTEQEAHACVEYALELGGSDVNAVDEKGETALHGAAYRGATSIVRTLVEHGAVTFDAENAAGWTPLRIAKGVFRTATYKESPPTAALLEDLMSARSQLPR
jgi:ankyrin repeat protein